MVNKYIRETEKNLRQLLDAAEDGGAVVFFDEADALFGKGSEVKDSRDRYANLNVACLLERVEDFDGLAILATNRKENIDSKWLRGFQYVLPLPGRKPKRHARSRTKRTKRTR